MQCKELIEQGLVEELKNLLVKNPELSNKKIKWGQKNKNETDPLHYVSDCVFNGWLTNGKEAELASILIANGAEINGTNGAETPLIGAASLSVESVARMLIEAGANIELTSIHGATALHWACYVGLPSIVQLLLKNGADIEQKCEDFQATPLFWAVQGIYIGQQNNKDEIIKVIKILLDFGAELHSSNFQGVTVIKRAYESNYKKIIQLIDASLK
jgi:ankyrin repeat protein